MPPPTSPTLIALNADPFVVAWLGANEAATSAHSAPPHPTPAQAAAGNYVMGRVNWHGLGIAIENPARSVREGRSPDGSTWRNVIQAHYGYFAGTKGADGDGVDVFVGPVPESPAAWVINQTDGRGGFDEHKVLVGFVDEASAVNAYRLSYSPGWDRFERPMPITPEQLRWWLKFGNTSRPITSDQIPPEPQAMTETTPLPITRVFWDSAANPTAGMTLGSLHYALSLHDAKDRLMLDPVTMADITEGAEILRMDALVTEVGRLKPKMEALQRIMETAGGDVKPVALQLSEPVRRYGGAHVAAIFELSDGQTITVWFHNPDATPAKLTPADTMVSWKWMLNKKDVTIVVAPEHGEDLNLREVARRTMRLAAKNSEAFARANTKRAATLAEIAGLRDTLADRKATLERLMGQIEVAKVARDDRAAAAAKAAAIPAALARLVELGWAMTETGRGAEKSFPGVAIAGDLTDGSRTLVAQLNEGGSAVGLFAGWDQIGVYLKADRADVGDNINAMAERWASDRRAELAPKPAWQAADADPSLSSDAYHRVFNAGDEALTYWQDALDATFQKRLIDIRNALRDLGWEAEQYKWPLTKGGASVNVDLKQVGSGKNIVGVLWTVSGNVKIGYGDPVRDDLSTTPQEFAMELNGAVKVAPAESDDERMARIKATPGAQRTDEDIAWYNERWRAQQEATGPARFTLDKYLATLDSPQEQGKARAALTATVTWGDGLKGELYLHIANAVQAGARMAMTSRGMALVNPETMSGWGKGSLGTWGLAYAIWASEKAGPAPEVKPARDYGDFEEAVTQLIEAQEVTRSDAQGMVEAAAAAMRNAFEGGKTPEETVALLWPAGTAENEQHQYLRDVRDGKHDSSDLAELLLAISKAIEALEGDGLLTGEVDSDASAAIMHWAQLDEAAEAAAA